MAIQINGNGTITGISVGGLPDGIVDTDMIANNAVATAKIADNAVTNAKATGIAGGKILQVVQTKLSTQVNINNDTETEVINCAITPSATTSKILTTLTSAPAGVGSGTEFYLYLYRDSTFVYGYTYYFGSGAAEAYIAGPNGMYLDTPATTSQITYRVKIKRRWGSGNITYNHTNTSASSTLTLMEVAQ